MSYRSDVISAAKKKANIRTIRELRAAPVDMVAPPVATEGHFFNYYIR